MTLNHYELAYIVMHLKYICKTLVISDGDIISDVKAE